MGDLYNYWKSQKPDSLRAVLEKVESCFEGEEGAGGCGLTQLSCRIFSAFRGTCGPPLPPLPTTPLPVPAGIQNAVTVLQLYAFVLFLLQENKALVMGAVILVLSFFAEGHSLCCSLISCVS